MGQQEHPPTTQKTQTQLSRLGPIDPSRLLLMVVGQPVIELRGFNHPRNKWHQVGIRFIGMTSYNKDVVHAELKQQGNRTRRVLIACAALVSGSLLIGLLALAAIRTPNIPSTTPAPLLWAVQQVNTNGVFVRTSAGNILIPIGSRLPNGEVLLSVGSDRQSYTTNAGRIQLTNKPL